MKIKYNDSFEISQLVAEFKQITEAYERALAQLPRRDDIVLELRDLKLTHKQIGLLLDISTGRVGQLVMRTPRHVTAKPAAE